MNRLHLRVCAIAIAALVALAGFSGQAYAQGPSGDYGSGITCVNLGTQTTTATITYYDGDGNVATTETNPAFAPNNPWLRFTPNIPGLGGGFLGSAVVSSGEPAGCSVNTQTTSGTTRVGTGEGVASDDTGPVQYVTQVVNALANFNSYVSVQNSGDSAADVKITYYDAGGNEVNSDTQNVPANASHVFYQDDGKLGANFNGSAVVEAVDGTTPLASAVAIYNTSTPQLLSFNGFSGGAEKVFLPRLVKNLSGVGFTSGWACQNLGPNTVDMTMDVTFTDQSDSSVKTFSLSKTNVAVGQAWGGYVGSDAGFASVTRGFGSAVVTASGGGNIACTVNEDNRNGGGVQPAFIGQGSTYAGVPDGEQSSTMTFPQIVALGANSFRGGFQYANTTSTPTTCTYTFSNGDVINNVDLAANAANSPFAQNVLINNKTDFNGSVTVTCGQPIVGIYNLSILGDNASGDPFATNNGINQ